MGDAGDEEASETVANLPRFEADAEAVREAGGTADLRVWTDVPHVWHLMRGRVPEADRGLAELAEFVRDNMAGTGQDQPIAPLPSQRDVL